MQLPPLRRATLIRRYKRFLADVRYLDGVEETAHVPNPGAMLGLSEPGRTVWLSCDGPKTRKLPSTVELVEADDALVCVNTQQPNRLAAEALAAGVLPSLTGYPLARREVRYGEASRVDFLLSDRAETARAWVEVKGVTLSRARGLAEWPDCVSARGSRHLRELMSKVGQGERAVVLFVMLRPDCERFEVAADLDPTFASTLRDALAAGVEMIVAQTEVGLDAMRITGQL
jgi:sugar fermentation stimulation protein A